MHQTTVIGRGEIGDKIRQLIAKTPHLLDIRYHSTQRTALAEDFHDGFFQRNGLGRNLRDVSLIDNLEERIRRGSLTQKQFQTIQQITDSYGNRPLAVRSSAEGDARGTGTYTSTFTNNHPSTLRRAVQEVLASYFSEDAIAFRRDAGTGEGFGILIEPIIGQDIDGDFAPVLSGFGYTSTSRGEGYINIVPGLGGGVSSRNGERITLSALKEYDGNLIQFLCGELMEMQLGQKTTRRSSLLRTDMHSILHHTFAGDAFHTRRRNKGFVGRTHFHLKYAGLGEAFEKLNLNPFFEMMQEMEEHFGKPQYFEWAMTLEQEGPRYWITQIADVNKKLDILDFGNIENILFNAHTVTGTQELVCPQMVTCTSPKDIESLYRFNQHNKGYALLFSAMLTASALPLKNLAASGIDPAYAAILPSYSKLTYKDFSNASVFLEEQDQAHVGDPVAHLGGQLELTGKLVGVLDEDAAPQWKKYHARVKEIDGLKVYQGKVRVIGSEKQNRMIIAALD